MAAQNGYILALGTFDGLPNNCDCITPSSQVIPATNQSLMFVFDTWNPVAQPTTPGDQYGQWYSHTPANSGAAQAAVVHGGVYHWLDSTGVVRYEVANQYYDDTAAPILTRIHFAPLGTIEGWERIWRVLMSSNARGACTVKFTANIDTNDLDVPAVWTRTIALNAGAGEIELHPTPGRATQAEYLIEELVSGYLTEGIAFRGLGLEVGIDGKLRRLKDAQRIT